MPASHVDWIPGMVFLVVGLAFGAVIVWRLLASKSKTRPAFDSLELRDLEGKRDSLIQQLRELDDSAAKVPSEEQAAERRRLELEAARTLRSIDLLRVRAPVEGKARARAMGATTHNSQLATGREGVVPATRGFLWGLGLASAVGLLIFFVSRVATQRVGEAQLTGNLPEAVQQQPDGELAALLTAVEKAPNDTNARLELAFAYLVRKNMMEVYTQTQYVLDRVPGEPRALTYQALVRLAMGQGDLAESMLKQALETEPDLLDARIHLALVYTQLGRQDEATEVMREAMRRHPEEKETLTTLLAQISASMTDPGSAASPPPAAVPAQADPASVSGMLDVDPAARASIRSGATLFLVARPAGAASGPPVAAKRLPVSSFPIRFQLTAADSMMGQPLPERMRIEARIDIDGDPSTRVENEPAAALDDVPLGASTLQLLLR